ncbi:VWA domain-containing protein [Virgisporangium aliadipatigenens]|uniref:VWA domain-containing protein n=1 Tax=Virgisporangium aliadipatigenens TaxID=741659 RepID=A0A8J3YGY1_9ACTN|nr:substrate-binding domain-containing protein [Virgisporangium aliadipatigenens]GIJ44207.1 VWA domain-containing protein [Virgisporangium aliadipatigenens]
MPSVHRARTGTHRRAHLAVPWVVGIVAAAVALSGASAGYAFISAASCGGTSRATVAVTPGVSGVLAALAKEWTAGEPKVDGRCATVTVVPREPALVAQELTYGVGAVLPDAWVPDSSAWLPANRRGAESLGRSPVVLAMPAPMAAAIGWTNTPPRWRELIARPGWEASGHPEWGPFRLAVRDPLRSTAALHGLVALLDRDANAALSDQELDGAAALREARAATEDDGEPLLDALRRADTAGPGGATALASAFPALEREVRAYNAAAPRTPLVSVRPLDAAADADFPYALLDAPAERRRVARAFLEYLRSAAGQQRLRAAGLEAPSPTGFPLDVTAPSRAAQRWTALSRPVNALLVLDVSGSTAERAQGYGRSRWEVMKEAAVSVTADLGPDAQVGIWIYATRLDGMRDHRELLPPGPARATHMALPTVLGTTEPGGNCGLYDTAIAAQASMRARLHPGTTTVVVLISDGRDEDDTGGPTAEEAHAALASDTRRVPVVTVALGADADVNALRALSAATGAPSYRSTDADLANTLRAAMAGPVGD